MNIKINTDNSISSSTEFEQKYSDELQSKLKRFDEYITSIDVYFGDEAKGKSGVDDKKCTIEVRIKNKQPEAVTHYADTIAHAFNGATDKVKSLLDTHIGKLQNK